MFVFSFIVLIFGFNNNEWFLVVGGTLGMIASPYFYHIEMKEKEEKRAKRG